MLLADVIDGASYEFALEIRNTFRHDIGLPTPPRSGRTPWTERPRRPTSPMSGRRPSGPEPAQQPQRPHKRERDKRALANSQRRRPNL
jgi:hypothetical protein